MYYVITDTHFGHEDIKTLANRPDNYEDLIIKSWNNLVKADDIVICLGDMAWSLSDLELFKDLKGKKILTLGNHDRFATTKYYQYFDFVCNEFSMSYKGFDIIFSHAPKIFHDCDINIHGHLHGLAIIKSVCAHFPIDLEHMGYRVISLNEIIKEIEWCRR